MTWSKNCVTLEISRTAAVAGDNPAVETLPAGAILLINNTKLYVPVATFYINDFILFRTLKTRI